MKRILLSLLICVCCINASAQEKKSFVQKLIDKGFMGTLEVGVGGKFLNLKGKDVTFFDFSPSLGYNINKYINVRIPFGGEFALFDRDGERDWAQNSTVGLGIGIVPFRYNEDNAQGLIELYLAAGTTTQHKYEWQYTFYDFKINLAHGKINKLQVGLGLRYYDARRMDNRMTGYISLGCRVN